MKFPPYEIVNEITAEQVYSIRLERGLCVAKKEGYVPTGEFRPVTKHDKAFLSDTGCVITNCSLGTTPPRIILREAKRVKVVRFRHTGIMRGSLKDEWVYVNGNMPYYQRGGEICPVSGEIVIREEREELE